MDFILSISGEELYEAISRGDDLVLADICPAESFKLGLIPGAINLPWNQINELAEQVITSKDAEIVLFSTDWDAGATVASTVELIEMGYTNVRFYIRDLNHLIEMSGKFENVFKSSQIVAA